MAVSPDGDAIFCGGGFYKGSDGTRALPDEYVRLFSIPEIETTRSE